MKKYVLDFIRRGLVACCLGPLVLIVFYLILQRQCNVQILSVREVCIGIASLSALAFITGGMNILYQIERLPLLMAILIHGTVLYAGYLATYLINGWLERGVTPILIFSLIFVVGYLAIWVIIYSINRRRTVNLNQILKQKQQNKKAA